MKTQVAIIGAGPAGLFLSEILYQHGIDNVVLEKNSHAHVLSRIRAGVLEQGSVELLRMYGLDKNLNQKGRVHHGFQIVWDNQDSVFIDLLKYTNKTLTTYGQTQIQQDLFDSAFARNAKIFTEVSNVNLMNINSIQPYINFIHQDNEIRLDCDFIAGCDGYHGVSRQAIKCEIYEKDYPFCWLGVLSSSPPLEKLTYASHPRGFALASLRNPQLSRYYIQVPKETHLNDWDDDRFWRELKTRFPNELRTNIMTGPIIEKSISALRCSIVEKMSHGRLFLAGDAAHILPPTGAKGLNLALSDVFYLSQAMIKFYKCSSTALLDTYSETALSRVWSAMNAARYLTHLLHRFPENNQLDHDAQRYELKRLKSSSYAQAALAEQYAGFPFN